MTWECNECDEAFIGGLVEHRCRESYEILMGHTCYHTNWEFTPGGCHVHNSCSITGAAIEEIEGMDGLTPIEAIDLETKYGSLVSYDRERSTLSIYSCEGGQTRVFEVMKLAE